MKLGGFQATRLTAAVQVQPATRFYSSPANTGNAASVLNPTREQRTLGSLGSGNH